MHVHRNVSDTDDDAVVVAADRLGNSIMAGEKGGPVAGMKGQRLLTSSYRDFHPCDLGDRYVAFLLSNERTERVLQHRVLMDHLDVIRKLCQTSRDDDGGGGIGMLALLGGPGGETVVDGGINGKGGDEQGSNYNKKGGLGGGAAAAAAGGGSIEIDAFQLLSHDPILGNLTLRYPDTLLELLEDSTVQARTVLRRRMEVALHSALEARTTEKQPQQPNPKNSSNEDAIERETNEMMQLLKALRYTKEWYEPRPLHARLVHLPPHMQYCKPTISSISSADVGTVVQICGTIVRTGPVRMMETRRTYMCLGKGCGVKFSVHADFGTTNNALPQPIICPSSSSSSSSASSNFDGGECKSTSLP